MLPKRISIKFPVQTGYDINLADFVPVFQRWIQEQNLEGLMIDVADYKHVHEGPGVLLIGHEGDYSLDVRDGRPGLLYTRKHDLPDTLPALLGLIFRLALIACQKLETESALQGIAFDYAQPEITFLDRLTTPNTSETFAAIYDDLRAFISELYQTGEINIVSSHSDAREPFAVQIGVGTSSDLNVKALIDRLSERQVV